MKFKNKAYSFNRSKFAYILIAPGVLLVIVILIYPLIRGVISSFFYQQPASMQFSKFAGVTFYKQLLNDEIFLLSLKNSFYWTIIIVIFQYLIGLGIALILNQDFAGRGIYRSLILIPWVVPNIAAAMTWKWIYAGQYGILNYILKSLHIIQKEINWLGNASTALPAIMVTSIWKGVPFIALVLLAALQVIDKTQYEVARMEGARAFQTFRYITLPGIKNISITLILLITIWTFNQIDLIYVMTKGGPQNSTQVIPVYTYILAFDFFNFNYAAAIGSIGLVFIGIVSIAYIRYTTKDDK
jgi:multiple sugar transport system permease protein